MEKQHNLEELHSDTKTTLSYACHLAGGCFPSQLLGARVRRLVVRAFSSELAARSGFGMRQKTMRDRWSQLIQLTAATPTALGFFKIDGGLRGLAQELDTDHVTLSRNLKTWAERPYPLVRTDFDLLSDCKSLGWIHIPLLTDWLIWTADQRARLESGQPDHLYEKTIVALAEYMIPMGITPPCDITRQEASRLMVGAREFSHSVSGGPETLEMRLRRLREERREKFRKIRRKGYEQREERRRLAAIT